MIQEYEQWMKKQKVDDFQLTHDQSQDFQRHFDIDIERFKQSLKIIEK